MDYWLCVSVGLCVSVFSRERHNVRMLRASLSESSSMYIRKKKDMNSSKSGDAATTKAIWKYFDMMSFLDPYTSHQRYTLVICKLV